MKVKKKKLFSRPLHVQLYVLVKKLAPEDFIVQEDDDRSIVHSSGYFGINEEGFFLPNDGGSIQVPVKLESYTEWYAEFSESVFKVWDQTHKQGVLLASIAAVDSEYAKRLFKHLGKPALQLVEKIAPELLDGSGTVEVETDTEDDGGIPISPAAAALLAARKEAAKAPADAGDSAEAEGEESATDTPTTPGAPVVEEADDWDDEDEAT